ncbi:MAG: amino acid racemase [Clostridiales bacterium]|nr:amino acid racemase [Clostridiales bacterium]
MSDIEKKTLGIIGGLGPLASAHFYKMITEHTKAERDADNLNIIIYSRADTPDRTAYIMGKSDESPVPALIKSAGTLERAGAEVLAIPCNTSHMFLDEISAAVSIPVLSMVELTADFVRNCGCRRAGIMATDGTLASGIYKRALSERGIECVYPDTETQRLIMSVIYDYVKAGRAGGEAIFRKAAEKMLSTGCDAVILGCTELPLVAYDDERFIDTLEVLACEAIKYCGGEPCGFSALLMEGCGHEIR